MRWLIDKIIKFVFFMTYGMLMGCGPMLPFVLTWMFITFIIGIFIGRIL